MENRIIKNLNEEEWLKEREKYITSTDAACFFNANPYKGLFELWQEHRAKLDGTWEKPKKEENKRMAIGRLLESAIAEVIRYQTGWDLKPMKEFIIDKSLNVASSFDYKFRDDTIIEIKNVDGFQFAQKWLYGDDILPPAHIEFQVQHQMWIAQKDKAVIAAFVGGNEVHLIERQRDPEIITALTKEIEKFWNSVSERRPPKIEHKKDFEFIFKQHQGKDKPLSALDLDQLSQDELMSWVKAYHMAGLSEKKYKLEKDKNKALILNKIKDASAVEYKDVYKVTASHVPEKEMPPKPAYLKPASRSWRVTVEIEFNKQQTKRSNNV